MTTNDTQVVCNRCEEYGDQYDITPCAFCSQPACVVHGCLQPHTCTRPRFYWVGMYLIERVHGGPEEGGWYYDTGVLVTDPTLYDGLAPAAYSTREAAVLAMHVLYEKTKKLNEGRSVLSGGIYQAEIHEDSLPSFYYPETRPHYE